MDYFVKIVAPRGKVDFVAKLLAFMTICGASNHLRDFLMYAATDQNTFLENVIDASFTAGPMCFFALLLIGYLNRLQMDLYRQANRDVLTGLPNRRWFMDNTPDALADGQALCIIDIDHFKRINDRFGHDAGDRCLQQMAANLSDLLENGATCARIGGEEFAVFMPETSPPEMETLGTRIAAGFLFSPSPHEKVHVTASVGFSCGSALPDRQQALRVADDAVYQAKKDGRARFVIQQEACSGQFAPHIHAAE